MKHTTLLIWGFFFSFIHAGMALYCIVTSFGISMSHFDSAQPFPTSIEPFSFFAGTLSLPGRLIWTRWMNETMPSMEWPLFFANSLLWGFGTAFILFCFFNILFHRSSRS